LFRFLGFDFFTSKFCNSHLFTDNLSPLFATTRWWSTSQSAPLKEDKWTSAHISQYLMKQFSSQKRSQVYLWMFWAGTLCIWQLVAKFTTVITLSLLVSCKSSFLTVGLKRSSLPDFCWNLLTEFSCDA
jgi:hypothetical protein